MMSRMKVLIQISSSSMYTTTMMMNKRHVAEQLPGVITFVLIICLAMRFVVLYTWIKSVHKSLDCEKGEQPIWFGVAFGFMFIGNPEEKSIDLFPVATEKQLMRKHHHNILVNIKKAASLSQRWRWVRQHRSTAGIQKTCSERACVSLSVDSMRRSLSSPTLGGVILGFRRTTDCRTENRWGTRGSPGPEGGLARELPPAAPWAAPARPPCSSQGHWESESSPCGSSPTGQARASCRGRWPGWRRDRRPSCSERMHNGVRYIFRSRLSSYATLVKHVQKQTKKTWAT